MLGLGAQPALWNVHQILHGDVNALASQQVTLLPPVSPSLKILWLEGFQQDFPTDHNHAMRTSIPEQDL